MTGETLIEGLEGITKIEGITDFLFSAIYWIAVVFVLLLVSYICVSINVYFNNRRKGLTRYDKDDFLD